jgi:hypothetical protein
MPFDSARFRSDKQVPIRLSTADLIDLAAAPCPTWTAENPDRALALLFVAPQDCAAIDVLVSL